MKVIQLDKNVLEDLSYWAKTDLKILKRIVELISDTAQNPFTGLGKPEPLKHEWKGYWSKRITDEHRLIYKVSDTAVIFASARFHNSK
jgi:toxin YoeB